MTGSTFFVLMAEFQTAHIPLDKLCMNYFGIKPQEARARAARNKLPVPAFKISSSQKAGWFIDAQVLAEYLDSKKEEANAEWKKSQNAA
jgi:hypothetical protein